MAACKVGNQYKTSGKRPNEQNYKYGLLTGHKTTKLIISSVNQNSEAE